MTVKNTVISPNFLVWKFCGKAQFLRSFSDLPKTMWKLCLSVKSSEITVFFVEYDTIWVFPTYLIQRAIFRVA